MAIVFGKVQAAAEKAMAVLAPVFEKDLVVLDETDADSGSANGGLRVITNYRGFTRDKAGRKSALLHKTVIDLSAIGQAIPLAELGGVIEALTKVKAELDEAGVLGGKGDPTATG